MMASWYATDGVSPDEVAAASSQLPCCRALSEHARAWGERLVVLKPGMVPGPRLRLRQVSASMGTPTTNASVEVAP
jgi:hypothetical protein